jgi:hypothetical protein
MFQEEKDNQRRRCAWETLSPEERAVRLLLAGAAYGRAHAESYAIMRADSALHVSVLQTGQQYGFALALEWFVPGPYLVVSCFVDTLTDVDLINEGRSRCLTARGWKCTRDRRRILKVVAAYLNRHVAAPTENFS